MVLALVAHSAVAAPEENDSVEKLQERAEAETPAPKLRGGTSPATAPGASDSGVETSGVSTDNAMPPQAPQSAGGSAKPAENEARTGAVVVIVFPAEGQAAEGRLFRLCGGVTLETDARGAIRDEVPAGVCEVVLLAADGAEQGKARVPIAAGETSQVLLSLDSSGAIVDTDVEAPGQQETEQATQQVQEVVAKGTVTGIVRSLETNEPVAGARIFVRGVKIDATTDEQGRFSLTLPVGVVALSALHKKHSTQTVADLEVLPDDTVELEIVLTPSAQELEDFIIKAPHIKGGVAALTAARRETTSVAEVIGAEQMEKSGDTDAASALRRVTGLTVVGRFVFVRGMGERYSATRVNGLNVPSPEPTRRVVPMDLFPAGIIESMTIQKTFSPDQQGEFGGGTVQLRTKSFPDEFTFSFSLNGGFRVDSTLEDSFSYVGGDLDWLGFDDGTRDMPGLIEDGREIIEAGRRPQEGEYTAEEIEELSRSFSNEYLLHTRRVPVNHGASLTLGDSGELGGMEVGGMVSLRYSRAFALTQLQSQRLAVDTNLDTVRPTQAFDITRDEEAIDLGGIAVLGIKPAKNQSIEATSMWLRTSEKNSRFVDGFSESLGVDFRNFQQQWVERQLFAQQLYGEHHFTLSEDEETTRLSPKLNWRYGFSQAQRAEPDRRQVRYDLINGLYAVSRDNGGVERIYQDLEDSMHEIGLDLSWPIAIVPKEWEVTPQIGGMASIRTRNADGRRFEFTRSGAAPPRAALPFTAGEPNIALAPENISDDGFLIQEVTLSSTDDKGSDSYVADQQLYAAYGLVRLVAASDWDLMAGARLESILQVTESFDQFDPENRISAEVDEVDVLPAATLTWRLSEQMQLRLGYGKTVSRPDFREKSLSRFIDIENRVALTGNPELEQASLDNYDVRWEWYPNPDDNLSVAFFYKDFDRPIELVAKQASGEEWSWLNTDSAVNFGFEIEGRKRLGFVHESLEDVYIAGNASLISSKVNIDNSDTVGSTGIALTSTERPLQGQSPFVVNAQLGYDGVQENAGLTATLLYNVFGRRIASIGSNGVPDIFEEPIHQLDLVGSYKFGEHWKLSLAARNLLNQAARRTMDFAGERNDVRTQIPNRSFRAQVKWNF